VARVGTLNISDLCGNFWAWEPFDRDELIQRYRAVDAYEDAYEEVVEDRVDEGTSWKTTPKRWLKLPPLTSNH